MTAAGPNVVAPEVVASRYVEATGIVAISPSRFNPGVYESRFGIVSPCLERAAVGMSRKAERMIDPAAPIGWYDPAINDWLFPEEYVHSGERPPLARLFAETILSDARRRLAEPMARAGNVVVDNHHPHTQAVRRIMAETLAPLRPMDLLARSGVAEQLITPPGISPESVATDGATFCFAQYSPVELNATKVEVVPGGDTITQQHKVVAFGGSLTLCYTGLQIGTAGGHTQRTAALLPLVMRHPDSPDIWRANTEVLTSAEWELAQPLPGLLERATNRLPNFSPSFAAIAYNLPPRV